MSCPPHPPQQISILANFNFNKYNSEIFKLTLMVLHHIGNFKFFCHFQHYTKWSYLNIKYKKQVFSSGVCNEFDWYKLRCRKDVCVLPSSVNPSTDWTLKDENFTSKNTISFLLQKQIMGIFEEHFGVTQLIVRPPKNSLTDPCCCRSAVGLYIINKHSEILLS